MAEDVTVISARRSYEFRADEIRLTLLSNRGVLRHIQEQFSFEVAAVNTPMETFGPVQPSIPPGLIFDYGITPFPEGQAAAIRFLHIEQRRIVIDVAAPSSVIDPTFHLLKGLLVDVLAFDGAPAIGQPTHTMDFSEITARFPFPGEALLPPKLRSPYRRVFGIGNAQEETHIVPTLQVRVLPRNEEFAGSAARDIRSSFLELRAGTVPADQIFYSGAPLDSDSHIDILTEIERSLASQWKK
ncbi:MAG: hypothetical protein ACRDJH_04360 [Thermomicrobiales bacterium]